MRPLRIPLRIVFYKESGRWIAHCLEFDLVGDGRTRDAALRLLSKAITAQILAFRKYNNLRNLFTPADGKYFEMFAAGKDVTTGEIVGQVPAELPMIIQPVETREYSRAPAALV